MRLKDFFQKKKNNLSDVLKLIYKFTRNLNIQFVTDKQLFYAGPYWTLPIEDQQFYSTKHKILFYK